MVLVTSSITYIALMVLIAGVVASLEIKYEDSTFFKYVPTPVAIYFVCMLLSFVGVFQRSAELSDTFVSARALLFPAMIFLMMMRCDLRKLLDLGPRMLVGFFSATITIMIGFVAMFAIMKGFFHEESWKTWGALAGTWIGGAGNMAAIQGKYGITEAEMANTLRVNDVIYAVWMVVLLAVVPFANRFNRWANSRTRFIEEIGGKLAILDERAKARLQTADLILVLGASMFVAAICRELARAASPLLTGAFGVNDLLSVGTLGIVLSALCGIAASTSSFAKVPGSNQVSMTMFYIVIALMGSQAKFEDLGAAPIYLFAGCMILAIHAALMVLIAKFARLDLFTCTVASLANIGAIVGAPILAAAYRDSLVPVGILMSVLGYLIGTAGGGFVTYVLAILGGGA